MSAERRRKRLLTDDAYARDYLLRRLRTARGRWVTGRLSVEPAVEARLTAVMAGLVADGEAETRKNPVNKFVEYRAPDPGARRAALDRRTLTHSPHVAKWATTDDALCREWVVSALRGAGTVLHSALFRNSPVRPAARFNGFVTGLVAEGLVEVTTAPAEGATQGRAGRYYRWVGPQ